MENISDLKERRYILLNGRSPLEFLLQNKDSHRKRLLYYDNDKKINRSLRYGRNQKSPFVDEQDDNVIVEPISFLDGHLVVKSTDIALQKFLDFHPGNKRNGGFIFEEYDAEAIAEANLKQEDMRYDAETKARNLEIDEMESIARTLLRLNPDDLSSKELKRDIIRFAKSNPEKFLDVVNNKVSLKTNDIAVRALDSGEVMVKNGRDVHYNTNDSKKKMFTIPIGESPAEALSKWLTTKDGEEFHRHLLRTFNVK